MVDRGILNGWNDKVLILDNTWEPGCWDVICQGGRDSYEHIGNKRFRVCIDNNLNTYSAAKTKHEKSLVVTVIVDAVRDSSTQGKGGVLGGFVRKDPKSGRWFQVGDKIAREKVGHALRDALKQRQKMEKTKHGQSAPPDERPRAAKRRRTEGKALHEFPLVGEEPKKPTTEVRNAAERQSSSSSCGADNIMKSAEQSSGSIQSNDSSQCGGGGDIVLNELALATTASGAEDDEAAYQRSLEELQKVGEEDTFSFDNNISLGVAAGDPTTVCRKPPQALKESVPVSKQDHSLDDFMMRFLGGTATLTSNTTLRSSTTTNGFSWKPPSDSATEAAFDTYMASMNPKPPMIPSSMNPPGSTNKGFTWKPPSDSATEAAFERHMATLNPKPSMIASSSMKPPSCHKKPSIEPSSIGSKIPALVGIDSLEDGGFQLFATEKRPNNFGQLPSLIGLSNRIPP